ncbi:MAG: sel1 repeat family protein [Ignavibacteriae bacterium]|nr:sel1 repeat family protein [Ignavibacteriota bacterium]
MQNSLHTLDDGPLPDDGIKHTRADADAGHAEAQFGLAVLLACGSGDYSQAVQWYSRAADQNHRLAQFNLGQMYARGQGVELNETEAVMWIQRAAHGGDAGAQFNLGDRCGRASNHGIEADAPESRIESYKWFKLAAAQGYRDSLARCDAATMRMTHEEVSEGNRRVTDFVLS